MTTVCAEDREGGVRLLTLDRPPANAITPELLGDLEAALNAARGDDAVRAIVLTGEGRFFSGGVDLRGGIDFAAAVTPQAKSDPFAPLQTALTALLTFPKPTIAMLGGHAIAGGLILVLGCDYRLGLDANYRIGLNEVAIGASFPRAAFEIVRLRLSHQQANELLLGAAIYPASEAVRLGVVDELLPADAFEATVLRRAAHLGAFPREAYAHTKAALVSEAVARIVAETPEEGIRTAAVWMSAESVAARAEQARRLTKGA
jgi:enoyl-CoA hydratase/carnithine racemase